MTSDILDGYVCACGNKYDQNHPSDFRRIGESILRDGQYYHFQCVKCQKCFMLHYACFLKADGCETEELGLCNQENLLTRGGPKNMTEDDEKLHPSLSARQSRALPHLLTSPTWEEGRKKAGISRNTLNKWFKEPEFKRAFDQERNNLFLEAMDLMKAHTIRAVSGLVSLLDTENQTLKRYVCNDILQLVLRFRELQNIEERLQVLERTVFEDEPYKPGRGGYVY